MTRDWAGVSSATIFGPDVVRRGPTEDRDSRTHASRVLSGKLGMVPEADRLDGLPGQRAALQDLVLRLVVVGGGLVLLEHFLEGDDVLVLRLDHQLDFGRVDRRLREGVDDDRHEQDEKRRDGDPAALVEHADVVRQVHFGRGQEVGVAIARRAARRAWATPLPRSRSRRRGATATARRPSCRQGPRALSGSPVSGPSRSVFGGVSPDGAASWARWIRGSGIEDRLLEVALRDHDGVAGLDDVGEARP